MEPRPPGQFGVRIAVSLLAAIGTCIIGTMVVLVCIMLYTAFQQFGVWPAVIIGGFLVVWAGWWSFFYFGRFNL